MNEGWLVVSAPLLIGALAWFARKGAGWLALRKLRRLTRHRMALERIWTLIDRLPPALLDIHVRRALGRILRHHLERSLNRRATTGGEQLRIAQFIGRTPPFTPVRPSEELAAALRGLMALLDQALAGRIIPVTVHIRAHDRLRSALTDIESSLTQRKARIAGLLHLPLAQAART